MDPEAAPPPPSSPPLESNPEDRVEAPAEAGKEAERSAEPASVEEMNNSEDAGDKKRSEDGGEGEGCRPCSCKKSRCLKLYCICFSTGTYCSELCGCQQCFNKLTYKEEVLSARKELQLRNKFSPSSKALRSSEVGQEDETKKSPGSALVKRGCTCKKSSCLKKYCDCYQSGIGCTIYCKCEDCKNVFGRKDAEDEEDYPIAYRSPYSKESLFLQDHPDDIGGHIIAQPLSQLQPPPWCLKRPVENGIMDVPTSYADYRYPRDKQLQPKHEKVYSISKCIEVMNAMTELSKNEKSLAPDVFLEPSNREIFLSLSADIRMMWLRRKLQNL
ncbi:protein tesmin/TSO1-like CXC 2 isoform X2 [Ananas comosus]|uniref:Protein tesmin/TSO1-like CXC 2 n=2 Tax=Ananas comosus TaxID=4615 RepID=A0A199VPV6_ANACO|nr:protein tesmin/TSO1-like CXC 2 isoform X2 [Ananas comosus]OAY78951.1 Protein tesmin/TSO1-like CXC 2 [Ananas comosus]CAD1828050.1 unnamed protein product [Ananas comosus var. bracteatus]